MKRFREEQGFTLIELMVVILIIGILVAIAIPVFNNARESAYQKTCQASLRTIDGAIQTFRADNNNWPANVTALVNDGYLKSGPECPKDGAALTIVSTGTASGYPEAQCPNYHDDENHPHAY